MLYCFVSVSFSFYGKISLLFALWNLRPGLLYFPVMKVTAKEMADAKLPLNGRDYCAHLLIPLMKCRKDTYFAPWKCVHEKHDWEKCQYDELVFIIAV